MSRPLIAYQVSDISALARFLRKELAGRETPPSHVEMLNLLAQGAGHRNFQSLRSTAELEYEAPQVAPQADGAVVEKALRHFDNEGRLASWPARRQLQLAALWVVWMRLAAGREYAELELNEVLRRWHLFGDHALLRRELCDLEMLSRTADGRVYRRVEREPEVNALALMQALRARGAK